MSLWSDYYAERFNYETIEEDWGFLSYSIIKPYLAIQECYIIPEARKSHKAIELFNRAVRVAELEECTHLWTQVQVNDRGATRALRANLALGFSVISADNGRIIMTRATGG